MGLDGPDQWGTLAILAVVDALPLSAPSIEAPVPHSTGRHAFIFHPPRV